MASDYHQLLGVAPEASPEEIRRAYRVLVKRYHPDLNPEDPTTAARRFAEVTEAYEVLIATATTVTTSRGEPARRSARTHHAGGRGWDEISPDRPFDWTPWLRARERDEALEGVFPRGVPFSACRAGEAEANGDVTGHVELTLREMLLGATKQVILLDEEPCRGCQGQGREKVSRSFPCMACGGTGRLEETHIQGAWKSVDRCKVCKGSGTVERWDCSLCGGKGLEVHQDVVQVDFPAGSGPGRRLRLKKMGRWNESTKSRGDFYIEVADGTGTSGPRIRPPFPVPSRLLEEGGTLQVPGSHGLISVTVPAGTHDGGEIRVPDPGLGARTYVVRRVEPEAPKDPAGAPFPEGIAAVVPPAPGEGFLGSWPAYLDAPDRRALLVLTDRRLLVLSPPEKGKPRLLWWLPAANLDLQPLEAPDDSRAQQSALWAMNIGGRRIFFRSTLAQVGRLHARLLEAQERGRRMAYH